MRSTISAILFLLMLTVPAAAQDIASPSTNTGPAVTAARLRMQLIELQAKEDELRLRLEQLNEALKPENIERDMAGAGSTRPEELREHRRRMLTIDKDSVLARLKVLEESRAHLESAISVADVETYLQAAQPTPTPSVQMYMAPSAAAPRWVRVLIIPALLLITIVIGAATGVMIKRAY